MIPPILIKVPKFDGAATHIADQPCAHHDFLSQKGLTRNDMVKEIQKCDCQMNRMFDRFMLVSGKVQSLPTMSIPSVTIHAPQPTIPRSLMFPQPQIYEPVAQTPTLHVRSISAGSSPVLPFPRPILPQVFFGCSRELETIIKLIFLATSPARIAIIGAGGIGKTTLAHAVLTDKRVTTCFADSRYLVPCELLTLWDALLIALANSFSLLQPGTTSDSYSVGLEPRMLSALGSKKCIICLDSFESPWDQPGPIRRATRRTVDRHLHTHCAIVRGLRPPSQRLQ
ncbi:hypothetical protein EDB86DRAFT_3150139 [Lactarius hatsudake]|nr:hypothetical protein EDB86DRAFT_3150139 [Lactarius hatsudake]